jgi:hypothetical protein
MVKFGIVSEPKEPQVSRLLKIFKQLAVTMKELAKNPWFRVGSLTRFFAFLEYRLRVMADGFPQI